MASGLQVERRGGVAPGRRAGRRRPSPRPSPARGSRPRAPGPSRRVRWERKASSWRMSARLMPCSRAISASRPRSSAERSRAGSAAPGVISAAELLERDLGRRAAPSAAPAERSSAVRSCSSWARRPISAWMSARRASTASTSRARIAAPCASTSSSSRRADASCASRCASSSASNIGFMRRPRLACGTALRAHRRVELGGEADARRRRPERAGEGVAGRRRRTGELVAARRPSVIVLDDLVERAAARSPARPCRPCGPRPSRRAPSAGSAVSADGREARRAGAHRLTPLAISIIWSAVLIALRRELEGALGLDHLDHRVGDVHVGALERALRRASVAAGARGRLAGGGGGGEGVVADRLQALRRADVDELDAAEPAARRRVTVPSAAIVTSSRATLARDRDRRLERARRWRGHEAAVAVELQRAVAREAGAAVGRPDAQEALALDGDVERLVRRAQRALGEAAAGVDRAPRRRRCARRRRRAAGLRVDEVAEADAHALVAGRVRVGQVVGDRVQALLLGGHAGRG